MKHTSKKSIPTPNPEGWEKKFDDRFYSEYELDSFKLVMATRIALKDFIHQTLAGQRQATLEFIEKNKKENECGNEDCEVCMWEENRGYNQALSDMAAYLTKGEEK